MKKKCNRLHSFIFPVVILSLLFFFGCSKKHKSERGTPSTGIPTNTGGGGEPGDSNSLDLTWAVKVNTSQADMEFMAQKIKTCNLGLWTGSEGQAYLRNQTLVDGTSDGDVVLESVKGPMGNPPAMCQFGGNYWQIWMSTGDMPAQGFLHELGHGWVGPFQGEEYNCIDQSAGTCIQAMMVIGMGPAEGFMKWCDSSNCTSGQQCWNKIKQTHGWSHPGPGGSPEPTCSVTIQ